MTQYYYAAYYDTETRRWFIDYDILEYPVWDPAEEEWRELNENEHPEYEKHAQRIRNLTPHVTGYTQNAMTGDVTCLSCHGHIINSQSETAIQKAMTEHTNHCPRKLHA